MPRRKQPTAAELPRKAALYTRVSTDMQADKDSLPMQRRDLIAYSEIILGIPDYEIFEDAGFSGKDIDRPAYTEMMRRVHNREFSHILVWKIDRISRNLKNFCDMYEELQDIGVTFISKNEQFDTSTAFGEAMLKILLIFAELERGLTAERVRATMVSRAGQGVWNGGRIPFGYVMEKDQDGLAVFTVRDDEAAVVRRIYDSYDARQSVTDICQELNGAGIKTRSQHQWTPTSVWHILTAIWYVGDYRYNRYKGTKKRKVNPSDQWVIVPDHHPAIIDRDLYDRVQARIEQMRRGGGGTSSVGHVFTDLVRCDRCGSRMSGTAARTYKDGVRAVVYYCPHQRNGSLVDGQVCTQHSVQERGLLDFTFAFLINLYQAKITFSSLKTPSDLEICLLRGGALHAYEHIAPTALAALWDVLSSFQGDQSYSVRGSFGRQLASVDPEMEQTRKDRQKLIRRIDRLRDAMLSGARISVADYNRRLDEMQAQLDEIDQRLGAVRVGLDPDAATEESVFRALRELCLLPEVRGRSFVTYGVCMQTMQPAAVNRLLRQIIDSVRVRDDDISIVLRDGIRVDFVMDEYYTRVRTKKDPDGGFIATDSRTGVQAHGPTRSQAIALCRAAVVAQKKEVE